MSRAKSIQFLLWGVLCVTAAVTVPAVVAHAEDDLEIDSQFFKSAKSPYEDDDLDRATKKDPLAVKTTQQQQNENAVKSEFSSVQPGLMSAEEASAMDQAVVRENKRRQQAILKRLAQNTPAVKACVDQSKQKFEGTHIRMAWLISRDGKTLQAAIKATDITSEEIQKCIYEASLKISFDEAATDHMKKSVAEYTYKFHKPRQPASVAAKKRAKVLKSKAKSLQK